MGLWVLIGIGVRADGGDLVDWREMGVCWMAAMAGWLAAGGGDLGEEVGVEVEWGGFGVEIDGWYSEGLHDRRWRKDWIVSYCLEYRWPLICKR
jgi:hypothetical protein